MNLDRVKELKLAKPFRQFYVLLHNGERVLVDTPESVGVAPDGSHMGICARHGVVILTPERVRDVDIMPTSLQAAE